jgi:hypothetical protein
MQLTAPIANTLWAASNLPAYRRFRLALRQPQVAQRRRLRDLLRRNAQTAFGKAHQFDSIHSYEEFANRIPLADYNDFAPWIARIRRGEPQVLTLERVTHLVPTSGSTGGRKLIPFTAGLQQEFNAAIAPWLMDLLSHVPDLLGGPAYWSITPVMHETKVEDSVVPIGFDADTAYLAGHRRRLAEAVMAVPTSVARSESIETFRYQTLLHLLRCRELRLISVWHPSFLMLLLEDLPMYWEHLLADIQCGTNFTLARQDRARELSRANPLQPETLWPTLRVVSCWGDAAAGFPMNQLRGRFPNVLLQPKGLIATEAFVTLPFKGQHPVAITSHFFEFIDSEGHVHPVESLHEGEIYEVVVTTAGGLWRYHLGDRVRVTGFIAETPSLKFLGRRGNVSDIFGEKLSEQFVCEVLREVFGSSKPRFVLLAPDHDEDGCHYTLYVEGEVTPHWARAIDHGLRKNPHYAYCRKLSQLLPLRLFSVAGQGYEIFIQHEGANGARLGDVKPSMLSCKSTWSRVFRGQYVSEYEENCPAGPISCAPAKASSRE